MSTLQKDVEVHCKDQHDPNPVETVIIPRTADIGNFEVDTPLKLHLNDIVWMEVFSENGNVGRFKEVVVLSR